MVAKVPGDNRTAKGNRGSLIASPAVAKQPETIIFREHQITLLLSGVKEGFEGSERVSGRDEDVSDETSIGSFTKFGLPWVMLN